MVGCIATASVRAPISSVAAIRPPSRGQAPVLGEEDLRRRWRDDTLVSGRNFTPGRQKSLGAHGAPSCAARQGSRRGVLVLANEARRSRRSACTSETPDPGIAHLLSAAPFRSHRLSHPLRTGRPCQKSLSCASTTGETRLQPPKRSDTRVCGRRPLRGDDASAQSRLNPGNRRFWADGADTSASTLAAFVPLGHSGNPLTTAGRVRRPPPQFQVSRRLDFGDALAGVGTVYDRARPRGPCLRLLAEHAEWLHPLAVAGLQLCPGAEGLAAPRFGFLPSRAVAGGRPSRNPPPESVGFLGSASFPCGIATP